MSLGFYAQKLGFEVRRDQSMGPGGNWLELAPPGAQTCLVLYPKAMMPNWAELKPSIVFSSKDVEATCRELAAKGVPITEGPKKMAWGTYAKIKDPDGNEFVISSM
jgi:predicted enzyme related to lactoylglutathione lyase